MIAREVAPAMLFSPALLLLGAPGVALFALIWIAGLACFLRAVLGR